MAMPQKTRKQKIKAAMRKRNINTYHPINTPPEKTNNVDLKTDSRNGSQILSHEENAIRNLFFKDLAKSSFIIISIIVLEIVLYYASMYTKLGNMIFTN